MAATACAINPVPHGGLDLDTVLVALTQNTGHSCPGGQGIALAVKNGSGAGITVTVKYTPTIDSLAVASRSVTVAAGHTELIPMQDAYEDPATYLVMFDVSAFASVSVAGIAVTS